MVWRRILILVGLWIIFECVISWVATCQPYYEQSPQYDGEKDHCTLFSGPIVSITRFGVTTLWRFLHANEHELIAGFTIVLAISTVLLWRSTYQLWQATKDAAERQTSETEILHRAYVSAELLGVEPMHDKSRVIAHVDYRNVGHLPAREFQSSYVYMKWTPDDEWAETALNPENVLEYKSVLPVHGSVTAGANNNIAANHLANRTGYIWVWGIVTYKDGFSPLRRYTKFCHRYPCAQRVGDKRRGYSIDAKYGRYHHHGNDAT